MELAPQPIQELFLLLVQVLLLDAKFYPIDELGWVVESQCLHSDALGLGVGPVGDFLKVIVELFAIGL